MRKLNVNKSPMPRPMKTAPQAKRVAPPAVPELYPLQQQQQQLLNSTDNPTATTSRSCTAEDGGFTQIRDKPAALKDVTAAQDPTSGYHTVVTSVANATSAGAAQLGPNLANLSASLLSHPQANCSASAFTFPLIGPRNTIPPPILPSEPLTHKAAVYYHQQLALQEDQGIDLTQSPGRDSPGSSSGSAGSGSRHSTASLDSGRASSYIASAASGGSGGGGGGGSGSSSGGPRSAASLSSPRCSVSSCSIGSVDRMSQRSSSESDLIFEWLCDLKFEEYAQLFTVAGYDMPTIARMTPEDLTAIGIKNPHHREKLKQHIDNLQLPADGLPSFVPGSIEEWLRLLRLEEYVQPLLEQNYKTVRDVTQVTWEDLEDIGIVKLGHQKKILLAIKRVKDIISGKWNPKSGIGVGGGGAVLASGIHGQPVFATPQQQQSEQYCWNISSANTSQRISWDESYMRNHSNKQTLTQLGISPATKTAPQEANEQMVVIKIRQPRGKSLESLEDPNEIQQTRSHLTFSHYSTDSYYYSSALAQQPQQQQQIASACGHFAHQSGGALIGSGNGGVQQEIICPTQSIGLAGNPLINVPYHLGNLAWRRSYDDGDITPTNDFCIELNGTGLAGTEVDSPLHYQSAQESVGAGGGSGSSSGGGGTLPRQRGNTGRSRMMAIAAAQAAIAATSSVGGSGRAHHQMAAAAAALVQHQHQKQQANLLSGICSPSSTENANAASNIRYGKQTCQSPSIQKKAAPEPPRRQCSVRSNSSTQQQQQSQLLDSPPNSVYDLSAKKYLHFDPLMQPHCLMQPLQQQPIYVNYSSVQTHQTTTAEIHNAALSSACDRQTPSHDTKSNSSTDSIDAIPFANENTGTIKQRLINRQEIASSLSLSSSSSSSSSTHTVANAGHTFHHSFSKSSLSEVVGAAGSATPHCCSASSVSQCNSADHTPPSPLSSPTISLSSAKYRQLHQHQPPSVGHNAYEVRYEAATNSVKLGNLPDDPAVMCCTPELPPNSIGLSPSNVADHSSNVLNDIGNMLANLTDELDAMLEEEKRVGISDSE